MNFDFSQEQVAFADEVEHFLDENEDWLERVLKQGRAEGSLRFEGSARDTARMIISSLEGAMLVARPYDDLRRFDAISTTVLASVES